MLFFFLNAWKAAVAWTLLVVQVCEGDWNSTCFLQVAVTLIIHLSLDLHSVTQMMSLGSFLVEGTLFHLNSSVSNLLVLVTSISAVIHFNPIERA